MKDIVTKFQHIGPCEINIDVVSKKWNHLWKIIQWGKEEFRLVKFLRKDSPDTELKVTISKGQAIEIITKLNLVSIQSLVFNSGKTWEKQ